MKFSISALLIVLLMTSCTVIKRQHLPGYYFERNHSAAVASVSERSSTTFPDDKICIAVPCDSVNTMRTISHWHSAPYAELMQINCTEQERDNAGRNSICGPVKVVKGNSGVRTGSPENNTIQIPDEPADEKLKWWEILLIAVVLAIGISCFAAIIIAGAETPLLVGILLIIPGVLIFGQSGAGGAVFTAMWGVLYIAVSFFKDKFSKTGLITYGILSLLLAMLSGFLVEEMTG